MVIEIRPYQPDDRASCLDIFTSNTPLYIDPTEQPDFETWLNGQDDKQLAYKKTSEEHYFVVIMNQRVIACGGYYISADKRSASMTWGMVHRNWHKQGVGSEFLKYRIEQIISQHSNLVISLDTSQHTFQFFERMGFEVMKITPDGYASGLHRYDMVYSCD